MGIIRKWWRSLPRAWRRAAVVAVTGTAGFVIHQFWGWLDPDLGPVFNTAADALKWALSFAPYLLLVALGFVVENQWDRLAQWVRLAWSYAKMVPGRLMDFARRSRPTPIALPYDHERLLSLIAQYQNQFGLRKLIIGRNDGQLYFDGRQPPDKINLMDAMFGGSSESLQGHFEKLMDTMPTDYLRFFYEVRWGSPYVVAITDTGKAYLAQRKERDGMLNSLIGHHYRE